MTGNVDISLIKNDIGIYDIKVENGDLKSNDSFETAIQMSVFNEVRANVAEVPAAERRRGWWGNTSSRVEGYQVGSKLWQLEQARRTPATLAKAIDHANNGLQWLIDDGYATEKEVTGEFTANSISLSIKIFRPQDKVISQTFELWNNTEEV